MGWQDAIERTVSGLGYELVDVERAPRGLLRVSIDRLAPSGLPRAADAFITVDDCERVTRQLQHVLEVEACTYERLEVSSPGLDRPLRKAADFDRYTGDQVALTLKQPLAGRRKFQGTLDEPADGAAGWRLVFEADGSGGAQALDFVLEDVKDARLVPVLDFKGRRFAAPPAEPGATAPAAGLADDGVANNEP